MSNHDRLPRRRLRLTLDLGADSLDALCDELRAIANDLQIDGREERSRTSGAYHTGHHLDLVVTDPDMNHERYAAELAAWRERDRSSADV